jgi:hypothetical protein
MRERGSAGARAHHCADPACTYAVVRLADAVDGDAPGGQFSPERWHRLWSGKS